MIINIDDIDLLYELSRNDLNSGFTIYRCNNNNNKNSLKTNYLKVKSVFLVDIFQEIIGICATTLYVRLT